MALHLEFKARIILHQLGNAGDFDEGLGLDVGLAGLKRDGICDDLAV